MIVLTESDRVIQDRSLEPTSAYRGWQIAVYSVKEKLWVRCKHPLDSYARYGIPVSEAGIPDAIDRVKSWIDMAISLEQREKLSQIP